MDNSTSNSNNSNNYRQFKSSNRNKQSNFGGETSGNNSRGKSTHGSNKYGRRYGYQSGNSNDHLPAGTPPQPVKILAKSNKDQQPSKPQPSIVIASNQSSSSSSTQKILAKSTVQLPEQEISKLTSTHRSGHPGTSSQVKSSNQSSSSAATVANSQVKILDKQFIRLQIASKLPKSSGGDPSSSSTTTTNAAGIKSSIKLLDGEFNFQEISKMEKLFLQDGAGVGLNQISVSGAVSSSSVSIPGSTSSSAASVPVTSTSVSTTTVTNRPSPGTQSFCIVGAVGLDGTGKSTLLNKIANEQVFKTHRLVSAGPKSFTGGAQLHPLSHVTNGIDLHITPERVFLLDTQPLLSASILDDFLRHPLNSNNSSSNANNGSRDHPHSHHHSQSHPSSSSSSSNPVTNSSTTTSSNNNSTLSSVVGFDITEPENFAFIQSLQLLTFLLTICDHLILTMDSMSLDPYLIKLVSTALMMVGDTVPKANLIVYSQSAVNHHAADCDHQQLDDDQLLLCGTKYLPQHFAMNKLLQRSILSILGPNINIEFIDNEQQLITTALKPPSRNLITDQTGPISYSSESAWLHSAHRYWDSSIRKSSLFSDYARYLP